MENLSSGFSCSRPFSLSTKGQAGMPVLLSIFAPPPEILSQLRCPYRSTSNKRAGGNRCGNRCQPAPHRCRPDSGSRYATIPSGQTIQQSERPRRWLSASVLCRHRHKPALVLPVHKIPSKKDSSRVPCQIYLLAKPFQPGPVRPAHGLRASEVRNVTTAARQGGRSVAHSTAWLASRRPDSRSQTSHRFEVRRREPQLRERRWSRSETPIHARRLELRSAQLR